MAIIRNILAIIGLIAVIGVGYAFAKMWPAVSEFDPRATDVYQEFAGNLLAEKDPGVAMMWKQKVEEGLTPEDVIDSLKSIATQRNFLFVGESPFYKQVEAVTGEPYRYINFLSFCDARVGKMMADYRNAYTGFMPCRIAVVEDQQGDLYLYTLNLDMMIYGGKELPPDLKEGALKVRDTIKAMMEGAAKGEF